MKKLVALALLSFGLLGCGNGWEITKKNIRSDLGNLRRHVVVYDSLAKKKVWEYVGVVYLSDNGSDSRGNYAFIYYDTNGMSRKNDFIGVHLTVSMREMTSEIEKELEETKDVDED